MRRSVLALIGTVAGTALMVGAKVGTHPANAPDPAALDTTPSGEPTSAPPPSSAAPKAGAILLQGTDISSASGLDPASLRRIVGSPSIVGR